MVKAFSATAGVSAHGFAVERPRASDAIGGALRQAFARDAGLPDDMMCLLMKLESKSRRHGDRDDRLNGRG